MASVLDEDGPDAVTQIFCDATFAVACKPFSQLLNVSIKYKGEHFLIYNVLMTGKCKELYALIFEQIRQNHPALLRNLKETMSDFESALIYGMASAFPDARHCGCSFHYTQAHNKNIRGNSN